MSVSSTGSRAWSMTESVPVVAMVGALLGPWDRSPSPTSPLHSLVLAKIISIRACHPTLLLPSFLIIRGSCLPGPPLELLIPPPAPHPPHPCRPRATPGRSPSRSARCFCLEETAVEGGRGPLHTYIPRKQSRSRREREQCHQWEGGHSQGPVVPHFDFGHRRQ